jgi:hypothetical protein
MPSMIKHYKIDFLQFIININNALNTTDFIDSGKTIR